MKDLFESSYKGSALAGVDEVGRGPLAGDVVAAAVILDPQQPIEGLRDSKKLTAARREELAQLIRSRALGWSIASASVAEIDETEHPAGVSFGDAPGGSGASTPA